MIDLEELINYLTIYQADVMIPAFRKEKEASYVRVIGKFCKTEIANSAKISKCWESILNSISST